MQTSFFSNTTADTSSSSSAIAAAGGSSSPKDLFTTLLVAQIKNQNPLEPTDPSEFVGQLTQLSQMEALQNLASQSTANASMLESMQVLSLGAQVGSEVMVASDQVTLGSEKVQGSFTLASASAKTTLVVTGAGGAEHRIELGTRSPGDVAFEIDPAKLGLPAGSYSLAVETSGNEAPAIEVAGTLQSVRLSSSGSVVLSVSNLGEVAPSYVTRFNGRSAT